MMLTPWFQQVLRWRATTLRIFVLWNFCYQALWSFLSWTLRSDIAGIRLFIRAPQKEPQRIWTLGIWRKSTQCSSTKSHDRCHRKAWRKLVVIYDTANMRKQMSSIFEIRQYFTKGPLDLQHQTRIFQNEVISPSEFEAASTWILKGSVPRVFLRLTFHGVRVMTVSSIANMSINSSVASPHDIRTSPFQWNLLPCYETGTCISNDWIYTRQYTVCVHM